jgi:uroporphyrinogen-III decarboxylase
MMTNPMAHVAYVDTPEEYMIKQPSDWRVINYVLRGIIAKLSPSYEVVQQAEDVLGNSGVTVGLIGKTAWQRAWTDLAGPERAVIDFHEQPEEVQEYIELNRRWHARLAEIAAECPAKCIIIGENISDMISPKYWRKYCLPIYEMYRKQLEGTGKTLGVHMDGRLGHLKKEIAETPINLIDSLTVPPTGDVSLAEAKRIWPDKTIFVNTAPHLAWAKPEEVRKGYEALASEWGSKKGLLLELIEELPLETVEAHMSAAMDAFGY